MSGGPKITWRVVGAAAVVAVILLALGWVYNERPRAAKVVAPPPRVGMRPKAVASRKLSNVVPPHGPPASGATSLDECGITKLPSPDDDGSRSASYERVIAATPETHDRWESALLDSSDSHARAVGLMIRRAALFRTDSPAQAEEPRDELVQLAAGAGDPALYAMAVGLCRKSSSDVNTVGACQRISPSEWTRIDSDNAVPWILAAQAARDRNDTEAEATSFSRAASAHKLDDYSDSLLSFGFAELPQGIAPAEKMSLAIELIGYEAAWGVPELREISSYCSDTALRRDETHKECDAVAELLVDQGATILTLGVGIRLGGRVGWSPERLKNLSQERDALFGILRDEPSSVSCETVNRMNAFFDRRVQLGELGALRDIRDAHASSGQPMSP
jgi:hypothetical protein